MRQGPATSPQPDDRIRSRQSQRPHRQPKEIKFPPGNSPNPPARHDFQGRTCSIISVGSYVPERVLSNADLEKMVDTTNEWILSRTGIKERLISAQHQVTSDLAAKAACLAMERAKIKPEEIDLIILAT